MAMTSCPVFVLAHDGSSTFFTARSLKKDEPHEHGTKAKKVHDRKEKGVGPGLLIMGGMMRKMMSKSLLSTTYSENDGFNVYF